MIVRVDRVHFENRSGERLAGSLHLPVSAPARGFALFAHCLACSKQLNVAARFASVLADAGIAVLRFDFTGLGESEGEFSDTNFSGNVEDLLAAADYLRTAHQAPRLLIGHSLGGALVLTAAPHVPEARALITVGAPANPNNVRKLLLPNSGSQLPGGQLQVSIGGRPFTLKQQFLEDLAQYASNAGLGALEQALLVMHSPDDSIVGFDQALEIFRAARPPKGFVSLDGADHLLSRAADARYAAGVVASWSARYLAPQQSKTETGVAHHTVVKLGDFGLTTHIQSEGHALVADEPVAMGGADRGPSPYGLLLSSLGACTAMTLSMYAKHKGWSLESVDVQLSHRRIHSRDCAECESQEPRVDLIERKVSLSGELDDAQRQRLLEIADRCPVHRTLTSETIIRTRLG